MYLARVEQWGPVKALGVRLLTLHQAIYQRTDGRVGHRLLGVPTLLLRTTGAKTGRERVNALVYGMAGDRFLVVPSNGGAARAPGWYHNLRAQPECEIQIGTRRVRARSRTIEPGDPEFDQAWRAVNAVNHNRYRGYQQATTRRIPVVELAPQRPS